MVTYFDSHKQNVLTVNMKEREESRIIGVFWFELLGV